jgi:hypothetical protein
LGAIEAGVAKKVPLIHILIFKYGVDWKELVNAPQGNKEDIEKAQKLLDEVRTYTCAASTLCLSRSVSETRKEKKQRKTKEKSAACKPLYFPYIAVLLFIR